METANLGYWVGFSKVPGIGPARLRTLLNYYGDVASAWQAGRLGGGPRVTSGSRLLRAVAGGALMGVGARLAYGCTSGLALSGGALLATGAWIFIPIAFGTAFLVTALARDPSVGAAS